MSGRKRKISLNCSLPLPPSTSTSTSTSSTLNTPDILDTVLNITAEQTLYKFSQTDQVTPATSGQPSNLPAERYNSLEVKEGLKMKVLEKIKEEPHNYVFHETKKKIKIENESLSDEERRHKRRERNKVAATKCRNKKKEQTAILMKEGEGVEQVNFNLKQEILRLEAEEKHLRTILDQHQPNCVKSCVDGVKYELLSTTTLSANEIAQCTNQDMFYSFGQHLELAGGDINESISKTDVFADNEDMAETNDMTGGKEEHAMKVEESQTNFSYFGTNFDLEDISHSNSSKHSNHSYGSTYRFLGVDSRFIVM